VSFCTVTFLVLFLISVVSFPLAIAFFGASPSQSDINGAVREWKVLKMLETRVVADAPANVNDEKFRKIISKLNAAINGDATITSVMQRLSGLKDSIMAQETESQSGVSDDIREKARLRANDLKAERDKYVRQNLYCRVGAALFEVHEAIELKDAKTFDVIHALLSADLLLRERTYDGSTAADYVVHGGLVAHHIEDALLHLGISTNAAYKLKSPGALDEVLRDLGKQLSSYGGRQRM
jgi:hypothetical protein